MGQIEHQPVTVSLGGPNQHGSLYLAQDALCNLARRLLELDERTRIEAGEDHAGEQSPGTTSPPRRTC